MGRHDSAPRRTVDADGVVRIERRSLSGLVVAAALALLAAAGWIFLDLRGELGQERRDAPAGSAAPPAARKPATAPGRSVAGAPVTPDDPDQPDELYLDQIDPASVEKTGIHLFPPPGTKPIKGGILVPEDYELPPGYMRHYQATDDGEPVQAILVFHPDHQPLDEDGQPIPLPADRVVPPELAPPDMPLQVLEPPPVRRDLEETSTPR